MIISHAPYILPAFIDGSLKPMGTDRTQGMHLSDIVKRMLKAEGAKNLEGIEGEQKWMRAQIGFLWEAAIEWAWQEYNGITRPVEHGAKLLYDDIHGSPDGIHKIEHRLEEYKFTWKSMRRWEEAAEEEFWSWMVQTQGYLHMWNQTHPDEHMNEVRFLVFWAGGAYQFKPGRGPQPTETVIGWEDAVLESNWKTILRYRDFMLKEVEDAVRE